MTDERRKKIEILAEKVLKLSTDTIIINLSFMGMTVAGFSYKAVYDLNGIGTDGEIIYYDPVFVLKAYGEENYVTRVLLHCMLHCLFNHNFMYDSVNKKMWDMASDISAEAAILELEFSGAFINRDIKFKKSLIRFKEKCRVLTADKIYRYMEENPNDEEVTALYEMAEKDIHTQWDKNKDNKNSKERWRKISERVRTELKNFSKRKNVGEEFYKNLDAALVKKQDYGDFLRRFMVHGEEIKLNDEEFDYVYYEYGLKNYGNMPLIEPLEYKEEKKISEFAVVIDTSASCRKEKIIKFIKRTYEILSERENFFNKVNVHIIQCDDKVQRDDRLTNPADMEKYIKNMKISGFGGTDFRPAFQYIDNLVKRGEFKNLKGIIYMTDGYGIYPSVRPKYDTAFVFIKEDGDLPEVPVWSMGIVW